jgi:hypothetical protein
MAKSKTPKLMTFEQWDNLPMADDDTERKTLEEWNQKYPTSKRRAFRESEQDMVADLLNENDGH